MSTSSSTRDEVLSGGFSSPSSSLLRLASGWGNFGGPGLFMIRAITAGTVSSIFTGVTGAMVSAAIYQTAGLPFLVCSCAGFILGMFGFYRDAVRKSILYLERYPRLIQIHLDANFPLQRFDRWGIDRLRRESFNSWTLRSMLLVSWLTAMPAIETIVDRDEQTAIEEAVAPSSNKT